MPWISDESVKHMLVETYTLTIWRVRQTHAVRNICPDYLTSQSTQVARKICPDYLTSQSTQAARKICPYYLTSQSTQAARNICPDYLTRQSTHAGRNIGKQLQIVISNRRRYWNDLAFNREMQSSKF